MSLSFAILVTGPAYGTQSASTAYRFARTLLAQGHTLSHLFFYQDGVCNGNGLHLPASDETDLVRLWRDLAEEQGIGIDVCVAAAMRRGVLDEQEAKGGRAGALQSASAILPERSGPVGRGCAHRRSAGSVLGGVMNKKIAFICSRGPHGHAAGREGLDALLATSAMTDELALFLIGDGVLQLLKEQQPAAILQRHYAPTFKMLELYDIEEVYVCADSLAERGVTVDDLLIPVESLPRQELARRWAQCSTHISF